MKRTGLAVLLTAVTIVALGLWISLGTQAAESDAGANVQASIIEAQINQQRLAAGLDEVNFVDDLKEAAEIRANEIADAYSSIRPDGTEFSTATDAVVTAESIGEWPEGYSGEQVVERIMANPLYGDNVLDPELTSCGVAIYEDGNDIYVAVEYR